MIGQQIKSLIQTLALTGYTVGANTAILATDNRIEAFGKVQGQINALSAGLGAYVLKSGDSMSGALLANAGVDVTATGGTDVLYIGNNSADVINIGRTGATINLFGTALFEYQANQYVLDKLITVNYNGAIASGGSSGFEIEENGSIAGYFKTSSTRDGFVFKAPAISYYSEFLASSLSGNRVYTLPNGNGTLAFTSDITTALSAYVPRVGTTVLNPITGGFYFDGYQVLYANDGLELSGAVDVNLVAVAGQVSLSGATGISIDGSANITPSRVLIADGSSKMITSGVSTTTLGYLDATSSIQTQLNSKASLSLTTGYIPVASSSTTIGNSIVYSDGTGVSINNGAAVPANNLLYLKGLGTSTKYTIHAVDSADADTFYVQDTGNAWVKGNITIGTASKGIVWADSDITNNNGIVAVNTGNRLSVATTNDLSVYVTSTTTQGAIAIYNNSGNKFVQLGRESTYSHLYNGDNGAPGTLVLSGTYPGGLTSSGSADNVVVQRSNTLGVYDMTGSVLKINDATLATGNLIDVVKNGTTVLTFSNVAKLTVTGTFQFITGNQGASKVWTSDGSGNADWAAIPAGITGLTAGYIPLAATSTTISNSIIYSDGTGVSVNNGAAVPANNLFYLKGIGTSTKYTLHLVDSAVADTFYVQDSGNTYVKGTLTIGNLANAGKVVYTDSAGKLVITSNININGSTFTVSGADNAVNINNTTTTGTDYALHAGAFSTALTTGQFSAAGWFNYRGTAQGSMNILMLEQSSSNALANTMGVSLSFGYKGAIHGYLEHKIPTITGGSEETTLSVYNRSAGSLVESIRFDGKNAKLLQVGGGLYVKEGTNATMGTATLVGGTVVVSTTKVTASSRIQITVSTAGGTQGHLSYTVSAGTSFTVTSASGTDTSTFNWIIIEPS